MGFISNDTAGGRRVNSWIVSNAPEQIEGVAPEKDVCASRSDRATGAQPWATRHPEDSDDELTFPDGLW